MSVSRSGPPPAARPGAQAGSASMPATAMSAIRRSTITATSGQDGWTTRRRTRPKGSSRYTGRGPACVQVHAGPRPGLRGQGVFLRCGQAEVRSAEPYGQIPLRHTDSGLSSGSSVGTRRSRCGTGNTMTLLWVMIIIASVIVLLLGSSVRVITQYERGVVFRFGRLPAAPRGPGLTLIAPGRRPDAQGQHADRHHAGARAGGHHPRQRDGAGRRGRLLPGRRPVRAWSTCRTTTPSWPGRADVAAVDHRQERPGRPAVRPGAAQPGPGADDRQPGAGLGHPDRPGRDQGRRTARVDEAVDVAAGRGRAGTAGADHHR